MLGKPWFLSIVSGVIAALLYFTMHSKDVDPRGQQHAAQLARKKQYRYALVFVVVAFLVYGSFLTAVSAGECRLPFDDVEIQTGGCPPF
jgi:hypothetical protein